MYYEKFSSNILIIKKKKNIVYFLLLKMLVLVIRREGLSKFALINHSNFETFYKILSKNLGETYFPNIFFCNCTYGKEYL